MVLLDSVPRLRGVLPAGAAVAPEQILLRSGAVHPGRVTAMRRPLARRVYTAAERLTARGQLVWFGLRKRWMADQVERAIAEGATQLLVVGAGFDPLASMVAGRHPDVLCVEVDAPATAAPKRAGVEGAGRAGRSACWRRCAARSRRAAGSPSRRWTPTSAGGRDWPISIGWCAGPCGSPASRCTSARDDLAAWCSPRRAPASLRRSRCLPSPRSCRARRTRCRRRTSAG